MNNITTYHDIIKSAILITIGFLFVVTPYDKFKKAIPRATPRPVIKVVGIFAIVAGIGLFLA